MPSQYGELRPTSGWDLLASLGHSSTLQRVSRLGSVRLLHGTLVVDVSQTLRRWTEGATYIRQGGHHHILVVHWLCGCCPIIHDVKQMSSDNMQRPSRTAWHDVVTCDRRHRWLSLCRVVHLKQCTVAFLGSTLPLNRTVVLLLVKPIWRSTPWLGYTLFARTISHMSISAYNGSCRLLPTTLVVQVEQ